MKMPAPVRLLLSICLLTLNATIAFADTLPDTLRILAIRVEFQPDQAASTTGDGRFDLRQNGEAFQIDPPPHDRSYFQDQLLFAKNYFQRISRGRLAVTAEVFPRARNAAYQLPAQMTAYNPNTSPEAINEGLARLLRDALTEADNDPDIVFSRYNTFIVFHAGVGRDIDLGLDNTPQDIASLYITSDFIQTHLGRDGIPVEGGSVIIRNGIILPETESQEGIQLGLNGMLVSNLGSRLGFPDLFSPDTHGSGVGRFGLMDAGLFNADGLVPPLPTAWTRIFAGWDAPTTFYSAQGDELQLFNPLDANGNVIKVAINEREYFLLENRYSGPLSLDSLQFVMSQSRNEAVSMREVLETQLSGEVTFSDSTGVLIDVVNPDIGLPGGGILIWHIDEQVIAANLSANRVNADPQHRGVDLEEADGSQDIGASFEFISGGAGSEIGTALDPWYQGNNAPLYQQSPEGEFSLRSIPNSRSYYNRANSHIRFYDFSARGPQMSFKVDAGFFESGFPQKVDPAVYGTISSLKMAEVDGSGKSVVLLTTDENKILQYPAANEWSSDSLQIAQLPVSSPLLPPLAIFDGPNNFPVLCAATREGTVYAFEYGRDTFGNPSLDTLFTVNLGTRLTTYPIVETLPQTGEQFVFLGAESGQVFRITSRSGQTSVEELFAFSAPVLHLHTIGPNKVITITADGLVYDNDQQIAEAEPDVFRPAGITAQTVSASGKFYRFLSPLVDLAEEGLHAFEASPIVIRAFDDFAGMPQTNLVTAGPNQLLAFNYNFTLRSNFPVDIYSPVQTARLSSSPIAAWLPGPDGNEVPGIVIGDPGGLLAGYDLMGNPLPDFPLALGDSLAGLPAFAQLDADAEMEMFAATKGGTLYAWELSSTWQPTVAPFWPQQYATPENTNRDVSIAGPQIDPTPNLELMPERSVYNWPNPNQDDFTFIRYHLTGRAEVQIKIFDLAGDLVRVLRGAGDANTDNEVRWDLANVQSGVYIARVEAKGDQKTAVHMIKIAVVK